MVPHDDPAVGRARVAWALLALCVLLGLVLFWQHGAAVVPLIREAR